MTDEKDEVYRLDVGQGVPFTFQRFQHLKRIEAGHVYWDDKWKVKRVVGSSKGSSLLGADFDFAERLGLAYRSQEKNKQKWSKYALTTDGQILLDQWKKGERS